MAADAAAVVIADARRLSSFSVASTSATRRFTSQHRQHSKNRVNVKI
jgi:hypothetical protein